jgi:hypothetical protein
MFSTPEKAGVVTIDRADGLHRGVTVLRNGGMLGVLIDQHAGDKGVWTPFFGRLASITPFPAVLAKKTSAALMPVSIVTSGIARWRVKVGDFIPSKEASTACLVSPGKFEIASTLQFYLRTQSGRELKPGSLAFHGALVIPGRCAIFFVSKFVREHSRSLTNQRNHYLRIAECIGADICRYSRTVAGLAPWRFDGRE